MRSRPSYRFARFAARWLSPRFVWPEARHDPPRLRRYRVVMVAPGAGKAPTADEIVAGVDVLEVRGGIVTSDLSSPLVWGSGEPETYRPPLTPIPDRPGWFATPDGLSIKPVFSLWDRETPWPEFCRSFGTSERSLEILRTAAEHFGVRPS